MPGWSTKVAEDTVGQEFIRQFFATKAKGYLIDVGAHAGDRKGSMTWDLLHHGWDGLLVEPLTSAFEQLAFNYMGHRTSVTCLQAACSDEDGEAWLYPHKGVSTINPDWAEACDKWWKHVNYGERYKVRKLRLDTILPIVGAPDKIQFLQVDTEGHDLQVLKGMDWSREPDLVCVETLDMVHPERKANGVCLPSPEMDSYLVSLGYRQVLLTKGGNGFYERIAA